MDRFAATQQAYEQYADKFADKLERLPEKAQLDEFIKMVQRDSQVLDLGCGSGRDADYLTQAGLKVIGIDLSAGLIQEAQRRHPAIEFQVMDMRKLEFGDSTFDGVWSKLAIFHVEREVLPEILNTVLSKLKPGGVIYLETKCGEGEGYEPVSFNPSEQRLFIYYTVDELKGILAEVGFVEVQGYEYNIDNEHATKTKDRAVVFGRKPVET